MCGMLSLAVVYDPLSFKICFSSLLNGLILTAVMISQKDKL